MRKAEIDDIRRRIEKRHANAAPSFELIKVDGLPGFDDFKISPASGFLAICGGTGVGKSALLELIFTAISDGRRETVSKSGRLNGSSVSVTIRHKDGVFERSTSIIGEESSLQEEYSHGLRLVGLRERTEQIKADFEHEEIEIIKEGVSPFNLEQEILKIVSFACQKEYAEVRVYEIELENDKIVPFFEVKEGNIVYGSRSMATGELSLLYIAWTLHVSDPYGIVLIEEPEAYLPPINHEAAFALIGSVALKKHLGVIITTHSRSIASELPTKSLVSLRRFQSR